MGQPVCERTWGILPVSRYERIYAVWDSPGLVRRWLVVKRWMVFGCCIAGGTYLYLGDRKSVV